MKKKLLSFFKKNKKRLFMVLRIAISISLIFFLIKTQFKDIRSITEVLRSANINLILLSAATHIFGVWITVVRWKTLLLTQKINLGMGYLTSSALIGLFFNILLPTSVGGDIFRAYDVAKKTGKPVEISLSVVLVGRFTGIISAMVYAIIALFLGFTAIGERSVIIPIAIFFFICAVIAFIILNPSLLRLDKIIGRIKFLNRIRQRLINIYQAFLNFKKFKWALVRVFIYSLLLQFSVILFYFFAARAFGIQLDLAAFFFIVPMITIIAMVPISIGGIGLRENSLVFIMLSLGVINEKAALTSLITLLFLLFLGIIGGIVYIVRPLILKGAGTKRSKNPV